MTTENPPKKPVQVTRELLYQQVWETPMSRLALAYGLSGNGLAKICDRLEVPYPSRGYWAKKAAGKGAVKYRLLPPKGSIPSFVTITPTPVPQPPPEPTPQILERTAAKRPDFKVAGRLANPYPIVAGWIADHERDRLRARADRGMGAHYVRRVPPFTELERRRHRLLDALFKGLEREGGKMHYDRGYLALRARGVEIAFDLRERHKQVRRPLTAEERNSRGQGVKDWPREMQPTGLLRLTVKTYLGGFRKEWSDETDSPLEDQLSEIAATLMTAAEVLAESAKRRAEEERRQERERQKKQQDANRWRRLTDLAETWQKARAARAFIAELKSRLDSSDVSIRRRPQHGHSGSIDRLRRRGLAL